MKKVNTGYTISVTPSNGCNTVEVFKNKATCLLLNIKEQFTKNAIKVLESETDLIVRLQHGPIRTSLFEEQCFSDYIHKSWIHTVSQLSSIQIEKVLLANIQANCSEELTVLFSKVKEASDEELLAKIRGVLSGVIGGRTVTIEGEENSRKILPIDYSEILLALRNKYDIANVHAIDLDDYLIGALDEYLQKQIGASTDLKELAYDSNSAEEFMHRVIKLAESCPGAYINGGEIKCSKQDGFSAAGIAGLDQPEIFISYLGVCAHHNGLEEFTAPLQTVYKLAGDEFWDVAWYELHRGYEVQLNEEAKKLKNRLKARIIVLEQMMKDKAARMAAKEATTLSENFNMSQKDVAEALGGISCGTVGNIQKKALAIMLKAFQEKGLDLKDLLCA